MKKILLFAVLAIYFFPLTAQKGDFKFGNISQDELRMTVYPKDSSAAAVVLNEFGSASINFDQNSNFRVFFKHHLRTKILKKEGFEEATFTIPLYQDYEKSAILVEFSASIFNTVDGKILEKKVDRNQIIYEKYSKDYRIAKFTFPDVKVGSIIEVSFLRDSPGSQYLYKLHNWSFQTDIPKVRSEFWAKIPGTFDYNISLKGFYQLSHKESEIQRSCISGRGGSADCSVHKYIMTDVPAFVEEDHMTAPSNYISSINFELMEYRGIQGELQKFSKEWKDVDKTLKDDEEFGGQFRKGAGNFWSDKLPASLSKETDTLTRAKIVYQVIKDHYTWNEVNSKYSKDGIKKAYDKKAGNTAEINISLLTALEYAGVIAHPVILSTRNNGLPTTIFPVLSDFNCVIGYCKIGNREYFLDATEKHLPFGMLPERCLNGQGRVFNKFKSEWITIPNIDKSKTIRYVELQLGVDGIFKGKITSNYFGHAAFLKRKEIAGFNSQEEFVKDLDEKSSNLKISAHSYESLNKLDTTLTEILDIEIRGNDELDADRVLLNPFVLGKLEKNPFQAKERLYPVDFGMPVEDQMIFSLQIPEKFEIISLPEKVALTLPSNGGKFLFNVQNQGNKISLVNILSFNRPIYSSEEYPYLKELYNKVVQSHNVDIILGKKK